MNEIFIKWLKVTPKLNLVRMFDVQVKYFLCFYYYKFVFSAHYLQKKFILLYSIVKEELSIIVHFLINKNKNKVETPGYIT